MGLTVALGEPYHVFKAAMLANVAALVVAHNHTPDNPEPSRDDIVVTRQLVEVGKLTGIPVHASCLGNRVCIHEALPNSPGVLARLFPKSRAHSPAVPSES